MFTIRVQRGGGHTVYACARYSVASGPTVGTCNIELVGTPEGDATITIAGGESAYVMNDTGRTVDTIKPALRTATAFRTGSQG